ncbi:MAG: GDP-L-fucose synthase, partial [Pyrinomonadaceae bacterium]
DVSQINIGTGEDIEIKQLAEIIKNIVGYEGEIEYDRTKPDGTPQKLLDVSRLGALGWKYSTSLEDGLRKTYKWFLENYLKAKTI